MLCDPNEGRLAYYDQLTRRLSPSRPDPVLGSPNDLTRLIRDHAIEYVVVTSPDWTHGDYITEFLHAGADVIVEKPIATTAEACRKVVEAVAVTGRSVRVTFNYRYAARNSKLREIVQAGAVGTVTSVHFEWLLDTSHGADYFRRWHRDKANSGGLLVHKASHHFDLVNWWIDRRPRRVFASGELRFYGSNNYARRAAQEGQSARIDMGDPFALDIGADPRLRALYLEPQRYDGYVRNADVFGDGITIEDNLAVIVDYSEGPALAYSLNAHSPWEGYRVAINGTEGRVELEVVERGAVIPNGRRQVELDPTAAEGTVEGGYVRQAGERLLTQRHWEDAVDVPLPRSGGSHGGGDDLLLADIFGPEAPDPLNRKADYSDGVWAASIGIAANLSMERGGPVEIAELGLGLGGG